MLVMRLRRIGRKNDPHYRIVVAQHTAPVQGKFLAEVGHYHPKSKELVLKQELVTEWLGKGAQVSNTVARLCTKAGITNDRIVVKELQGQPKKKAQDMAKSKADKAEQAAAPKDAPADEATETTTDDTVTEEVTDAPSEETTEEVSVDTDDSAAESTDEVTESMPDAQEAETTDEA